MITVLHLITDLGSGGAQALLFNLVNSTKSSNIRHIVVSLRDGGRYRILFENEGIEVLSLGINRLFHFLHGVCRLKKIIQQIKPTYVHAWLYHAMLLSAFSLFRNREIKCIWCIHNSSLEIGVIPKLTYLISRFLIPISYFIPEKIVFCSNSAASFHFKIGYCSQRSLVIHNGYSGEQFYPSEQLKSKFRKTLDIDESTFVCGMVARNDPVKDYPTLLTALELFKRDVDNWLCIIVGTNVELLQMEVHKRNLDNKVLLLGESNDILSIMNSLDVFVLSSKSEALPNVLAEAMLCGIPCIATRVGDVALLVGETGWIISPSSPEQLRTSLLNSFKLFKSGEIKSYGSLARLRILHCFNYDIMEKYYLDLWNN